MTGFGDEEGVLTHRRVGVTAKDAEQAILEAIETLQGPQGLDAGFGLGVAADLGHERANGGGEQANVLFHEHAEGVEADDLIRMIERGDEAGDIGFREVRDDELRSRFVLDAVDATKVVLAVRSHGSTRLTVHWTTGVIMRDDGGVEIEDVHRTIRTKGDVDRAEPMVHRAQPFAIL